GQRTRSEVTRSSDQRRDRADHLEGVAERAAEPGRAVEVELQRSVELRRGREVPSQMPADQRLELATTTVLGGAARGLGQREQVERAEAEVVYVQDRDGLELSGDPAADLESKLARVSEDLRDPGRQARLRPTAGIAARPGFGWRTLGQQQQHSLAEAAGRGRRGHRLDLREWPASGGGIESRCGSLEVAAYRVIHALADQNVTDRVERVDQVVEDLGDHRAVLDRDEVELGGPARRVATPPRACELEPIQGCDRGDG